MSAFIIQLDTAEFEQDIRALVMAFYPGHPILVQTKEQTENDKEPFRRLVIGFVQCASDKECVQLCLYREGAPLLQAEYETQVLVREGLRGKSTRQLTAEERDNRLQRKNECKRALYELFSQDVGHGLPWGTLTGIRPTKIPMAMLEEGKTAEEITQYMQSEYQTSPQKIALSMEIAARERALMKKLDYQNGYSLYVGIPFCPSICAYCSFSSYPLAAWKERVDAYLDALEKELDFLGEHCQGKKLDTLYIGGGTPTTLEPGQLERLCRMLSDRFPIQDALEWTVEAGRPDSITREKLAVLKKYPVSRISINPQTMKQETLRLIGRKHTVEQTKEAFWLAREMGFDNINMDLILGLPDETPEDVVHTMEEIERLSPDSLTIHSLAIKRAARLNTNKEEFEATRMLGSEALYELTARMAREMGLLPYYLYRQKNIAGNLENVGYGRDGSFGIYNILIMEELQSIYAAGAGASSKLVFGDDGQGGMRRERVENVKDVGQYLNRIDEMIERKRAILWQ